VRVFVGGRGGWNGGGCVKVKRGEEGGGGGGLEMAM